MLINLTEDENVTPMPEQIPELDTENYTISSLMVDILTGEIKLPVKIRFGRCCIGVTAEDKHGVCRGLLLAMQFQNRDTNFTLHDNIL